MTSEERYKNGKIYTIRYRGDDSLIYVGSTCLPLYKRMYKHKSNCLIETNKNYNLHVYKKIREIGDLNNWYIELFEEYPCENKEQLTKREGEIIRKIGTLNKKIEGRTRQEYINDNRKQIRENNNKYKNTNKETLSNKNKQFYLDNKDKISEQHRIYHEKNKEKILEKQREKIFCGCGCEVTKSQLKRHQQSKKHLDLVNLNSNENNENL